MFQSRLTAMFLARGISHANGLTHGHNPHDSPRIVPNRGTALAKAIWQWRTKTALCSIAAYFKIWTA